MVNAKRKGTRWENDAKDLLNDQDNGGKWKRVPLSGALGSIMNEPFLGADLVGKYRALSKPFMAEAKVGYGGKNMTIKKEWFDKITEIANKVFGIPIVLLKFSGARKGTRHVVAMSFETFEYIMDELDRLYDETRQDME